MCFLAWLEPFLHEANSFWVTFQFMDFIFARMDWLHCVCPCHHTRGYLWKGLGCYRLLNCSNPCKNCLIIVLVSWNLYSSVLTQNMRKTQSTDCYFSVSRDVSTKFKAYQPCRPDWKSCNLHSGPKVCWGLCVYCSDHVWHVLCSPPCHVQWLKSHDES